MEELSSTTILNISPPRLIGRSGGEKPVTNDLLRVSVIKHSSITVISSPIYSNIMGVESLILITPACVVDILPSSSLTLASW